MSAALPFTAMPLDWAHAFGGPELPANPVGRGIADDALPNIEDPRETIRSRNDRPAPAGFAPVNPSWSQRATKLGKDYGPGWVARRAPWYAEDMNWSYFQAAPPDQQLDGYLRGDEALRFTNLHPRFAVLEASLPRLRVRAFFRCKGARIRELTMNLDTLFADLEADAVTLTWRGLATVGQDDPSTSRRCSSPASRWASRSRRLTTSGCSSCSRPTRSGSRRRARWRTSARRGSHAWRRARRRCRRLAAAARRCLGPEMAAASGGSARPGEDLGAALAARRKQRPHAPDITSGPGRRSRSRYRPHSAGAAAADQGRPAAGAAWHGHAPEGLHGAGERRAGAGRRSARAGGRLPPPPPTWRSKPSRELLAELGIEEPRAARAWARPRPDRPGLPRAAHRGRDFRSRQPDRRAAHRRRFLRGASLAGGDSSHAVLTRQT